MRCLTLADQLSKRAIGCHFICREHQGNLIELIRSKGYAVYPLPVEPRPEPDVREPLLAHGHWLAATQTQDAEKCKLILDKLRPDWLIVDHYALDVKWEIAVGAHYDKLMVVDDLADRVHNCDLLLDQNLGRTEDDYLGLVPPHCSVLPGPRYALLRPEFAEYRAYSLARRKNTHILHNILISMGGVDAHNASALVLKALTSCSLPEHCQITVVMGSNAPWIDSVRQERSKMPWRTNVLVDVNNMAELISDADLCIGAAGSTSWERCALGVPSILLCLADNQRNVIEELAHQGVAIPLNLKELENGNSTLLKEALMRASDSLSDMSYKAARVTDGLGCARIVKRLVSER